MTAWLLLFASSIAWVFVQAFQSRNVNSGQYAWAAGGSFLIGTLQVYVLSTVVGPGASLFHTLTYCSGGAVGVVSAMWVHKCLLQHKPKG